MTQLFASPSQTQESDERYTPSWIFDGLGITFDTDPASPEAGGDYVPAHRKITALEDGLTAEWYGCVWLNPPFSNATPWARRFVSHGQGVFLGPVANSAWCTDLMAASGVVWFMRDLPFVHPDHAGKRSSMPLFMAAVGADEVSAVSGLALSGRHEGALLVPFRVAS